MDNHCSRCGKDVSAGDVAWTAVLDTRGDTGTVLCDDCGEGRTVLHVGGHRSYDHFGEWCSRDEFHQAAADLDGLAGRNEAVASAAVVNSLPRGTKWLVRFPRVLRLAKRLSLWTPPEVEAVGGTWTGVDVDAADATWTPGGAASTKWYTESDLDEKGEQ